MSGLDRMPANPTLMPNATSFVGLWVRFLTSGGLATAVHWSLMWLLMQFGMNATPATAVGAGAGAVTNYLMQYYHTFKCQTAHATVIPDYLKVVLVGWVANILLFYLLYSFLLNNAAWAQLLTTALVTLLNFTLYHKVVFHERE
ncbi:MAG TPA: GtrA family protein [Thiolapillus brandeum]|uniref:GtrA family protein n=1 Tax=Thiolapillus brandeum TaxID=1076588 RepID=A0A831WEV2_9GAMM|nr:GtrA family protein [Thiolapillus brandeum]